MRVISQRELRNDSGAILRAVEAGESMVVTRSGVPVAELRPVERRTFVPASGWSAAVKGLPTINLAQLKADIDRDVAPEPGDPFDRP